MTAQQTTANRKIGIVGIGPVGMILAVHFKKAGCEVFICDNDKIKVNLIRKEGIQLQGVIKEKAFFQNIHTGFEELLQEGLDWLFFSVKSYQLAPILENHAELIAKLAETHRKKLSVISAQNGIDVEEMLAGAFGEEMTMRMVINFAGNANAPNVTQVNFFLPPNYLASLDDSRKETASAIAALLRSTGLDTDQVSAFELLRRIWEKTILNSSLSALCGIGKLTIREAMQSPDTVEVIEQVIEEAVEVAAAEKIHFDDDFIRKCLRYLKKAGHHFPSLAVDLINNRPTEIDYFNGKIVEYGRKHYVRTSLNLVFTNVVKAMTHKNLMGQLGVGVKTTGKSLPGFQKDKAAKTTTACFLGVDLGSAYTKITVIDQDGQVLYQTALKTLNRDKIALRHVISAIQEEFPLQYSCATGYGRKHFPDADIVKTEINCAAKGVSHFFKGRKNIIDIGGEDIKVVHCDEHDNVENFYLNDKCAAGTGSFISEVAERAEINLSEMSDLAAKSSHKEELNSFCTVFAKTEIMGWLFDGKKVDDIAKGIYLSIANRVAKMRVDPTLPCYMIGGVIAYHPHIGEILEKRMDKEVAIIDNPQFVTSFGAAVMAKQYYARNNGNAPVQELTTTKTKN